jgi:hypothetical protein
MTERAEAAFIFVSHVPDMLGKGSLPTRSVDAEEMKDDAIEINATTNMNHIKAPQVSGVSPDGVLERIPKPSNLEALCKEICALDTLSSRIPLANSLCSEILKSEKKNQSENDAVEVHAQDLLELAKGRIEKKTGYLRLVSLLTFFCLYSAATLLQREGTLATDVEGRLHISETQCSKRILYVSDLSFLQFPLF